MITVVETQSFIKIAEKLMSARERTALIETIARNPEAGSVIPKTGGVRKLRFAQEGKGKSGSYRVIYYYYDEKNPVLLFTVFGKNQKINLSESEKNELYQIVQEIKKAMKS
jgi:mRNA-degrading endonuclease RelE of RelBE toxin-antitoxin system